MFVITSKMRLNNLSDKLSKTLVSNMDFEDSEINKFLNNQILNLVLTNLSQQHRSELYKLLKENNYSKIKKLVLRSIPNFSQLLLLKIKKKFQEIL